VAIVSETAARQFWPGRDAIGRRVSGRQWLKRELKHDSFTVIGIVKTVRSTYLSKLDGPFVYFPKAPPTGRTLLLVRTRTAPQGVFRSAYAALSAVHSSLPSQTTVLSLEQGPMEMQRLISEAPAVVSSLLGLLALVLAAVGVYGVVAYLVTRRTREIGVHIALGAQNRDVIGMVLRQSLRPVGAGAFVGLIGAIGLSGLLAAMVALPDVPDLTYGAGAVDPGAFLGALTALTLVVLLASFIPVRRATRVEPADALRND
jgi:ABC-type antimicrobial peptide transport system, permease component